MSAPLAGTEVKPIPDARLLDRRGPLVTVSSPVAMPQGTRVGFEIRASEAPPPIRIEGKVVSARRLEPGRFALTVRVHSLARSESDALDRALEVRRDERAKID